MARKQTNHYEKYGRKYYEAHKEKELARGAAYYQENREAKLERHRDYVLRSRYGITKAEYVELLEKQDHKCAICSTPADKTLDVDHDHTSGRVRGLLCNNCNRGIGHLKDDVDCLKRAIAYLETSHGS